MAYKRHRLALLHLDYRKWRKENSLGKLQHRLRLGQHARRVHPTSTTAQNDAVAKLMYNCGVSVDMGYGTGASGAQSSKIPGALSTYFGYDKGMAYLQRDCYGINQWGGDHIQRTRSQASGTLRRYIQFRTRQPGGTRICVTDTATDITTSTGMERNERRILQAHGSRPGQPGHRRRRKRIQLRTRSHCGNQEGRRGLKGTYNVLHG